MANKETLSYINIHRTDDPRKLALQSHPSGVDMQYALEQIAGWQAARRKLPEWAAVDGIVFPPHISMEQCSSQPTALYKRSLAARLSGGRGETLVDLTGGYGVDFSYMAEVFRRGVYVERQEVLCDAARHNMPLLGLDNVEILCGDGTEFLRTMGRHASLVYLDPARRDANGGRTYGIADCTPDVIQLREQLLDKADFVMIKLSPMLDWHKAVADMGGCVAEVHIVSVRNECKELLLVVDNKKGKAEPLRVFCVNCTDGSQQPAVDIFCAGDGIEAATATFADPDSNLYMYEPNASVMKYGRFGELCKKYGVSQIAPNSNLFVSAEHVDSFPGRHFLIDSISGMGKKELRQTLGGTKKANITTRNFPLSVAELRKRLKLRDGGDKYIFATTLRDGSHQLLVCRSAK